MVLSSANSQRRAIPATLRSSRHFLVASFAGMRLTLPSPGDGESEACRSHRGGPPVLGFNAP